MLDNFSKIFELFNTEDENDFYFIQILQRRKDGKQGRVPLPERPTRLVKTYDVRSVDHLSEKKDEIVELCNTFGARAQFNVNKRNYRKCALATLRELAENIDKEQYRKVSRAFSSSCGRYSAEDKTSKKWILDIDKEHEEDDIDTKVNSLVELIDELKPEGDKYVDVIPSLNGAHLITRPFDVQTFEQAKPFDVEVHKDAFTNLYIP